MGDPTHPNDKIHTLPLRASDAEALGSALAQLDPSPTPIRRSLVRFTAERRHQQPIQLEDMEFSVSIEASSNGYSDQRFEVAAEALRHLASIDLIELCNEVKVERCRATRDLRSCGRDVRHMLSSCRHASLCEECIQRCDLCPICRVPIPKNSDRLRLRLYYECLEAGLIPKRRDDKLDGEGDGGGQIIADVHRLYSLFDAALENNLVCLICHYVTDVCMDESAVSSDPVIAILLDEVVVKDWCKLTFKNIMAELQNIYSLNTEEMTRKLALLLKFSVGMAGISNVLKILESSFKGSVSAQLHDLNYLQESILKTKQHLEIMMWCIRHQFLERVRSHYPDFESWHFAVRERKSAAIKRAWPDSVNHVAESSRQEGSLFIEDALSNLDMEDRDISETGEEFGVKFLQKNGGFSVLRSNMEGMAGCYPFESLRAAIDVLFLHGSSDLVVAKQAIFLYYLFDRHWTEPNEEWGHVIDDFAATFNIARPSLLESLTFYLLDDYIDESLQEACRILPEISGPTTHPKIAQVLLERQNPEAALMVLRWSGRDGAQVVSLGEAVTAVRVRIECALLTEAFMYQRMVCMKNKESKLNHGASSDVLDLSGDASRTWADWLEALVTEICCLCIRRNIVDRMIELPWNSDEEKYLHKCLLEYAISDPSSTAGSLLVVFYLQRYRYAEAYQVDHQLKKEEQGFLSKNPVSEEVKCRMNSASYWRSGLVDRSLELLPEVQQQEVRTGKLPEIGVSGVNEAELPTKMDTNHSLQPKSASLLAPSVSDSSLVLRMDHGASSLKPSVFETPSKLVGSVRNGRFDPGSYGSGSFFQERFFKNSEGGLKPQTGIIKDSKFDDISRPAGRHVVPLSTLPLNDFNRSSSRVFQNNGLQDKQSNKISSDSQPKEFVYQFQNTSPPFRQGEMADFATTPSHNYGLYKASGQDCYPNVSSKRSASDGPDKPQRMVFSDDPMDVSWRYGQNGSAVEELHMKGGPRWRSDETSEDEEDQGPRRYLPRTNPRRGVRRSGFA